MNAPDRKADYGVEIDVGTTINDVPSPLFTLDALHWHLHSADAFPPAHRFDSGTPWIGSVMAYLQHCATNTHFRGFEETRFSQEPELTEEAIDAKIGKKPKAASRRRQTNSPAPAPAPSPAPSPASSGVKAVNQGAQAPARSAMSVESQSK